MIAQILENEQVYNTPVLAYRSRGWSRELVVFNRGYTELILLKSTFGNRAFILNWEGCTCSLSGWRMEPFLKEETLLWKTLRRRKRASVEAFPILREHAVPPQLPDWHEVKTELDHVNLMSLCMGFHDSRLIRIIPRESCTELRFDTSWGCYLTIRCIDVVREEGLREHTVFGEATLRWDAERALWHWSGGSGESAPQVVCRRILWHPTIETREFRKYHRGYRGIGELWEDLSEEYPSAILRDGVITLINGEDRMEIRETKTGYETSLNNEAEELWEDQDVYWQADAFMMDVREPAPSFIWQFTPQRRSYAAWLLPRVLAIPLAWMAVGAVLAAVGEMGWIAFGVLCGLPVLLSAVCGLLQVFTGRVPRFGFTETTVYLFDSGTVREVPLTQVRDIRARALPWNAETGSIRFKLERGGFCFFHVEELGSVQSMLTSLWVAASYREEMRLR